MSQQLNERTEFYDVWNGFVSRGEVSKVPMHIRASWERCQKIQLDPRKEGTPITIDQNSIQKRIDEHFDLHQIIQSHYKNFEKYFGFLPLGISFSDRDGYVLSIEGDDNILKLLEKRNVKIGACTKEHILGTTAPGICLGEQRFATVHAEEHYLQSLHWASCIAAPLFDYKHNFLGSLNFTVSVRDVEKLRHLMPSIFNIVNSVYFEYSLKRKLEQLELFDSYYHSTFNYARNVLVLIDRRGDVIDLNRNAQEVFNVNPGYIKNRDIRSILGDNCRIDLLLGGSNGKISFAARDTERYSAESIPIFDQLGKEVAFLLKIEKEKTYKVKPNRASNMAKCTFEKIIGTGPRMLNTIEKAKKAAKTGSNILLEGETGTGKELFAHAIHNESHYCEGPFVAINCSAIPRDLLESELFGYEKGAYTGALSDGNIGKFELANGGTIFLDEIHAMDMSGQVKLLRVIEDRQITKIGGRYAIPLNIRIVAGSSVNLEEEVERGRFVQGLFFRLNVIKLHIPGLRERWEDIPFLADYFIREMNQKFEHYISGVEPEALKIMAQYSWPGNVRELRNCIENAFNFCTGEMISSNDLMCIVPVEHTRKNGVDQTMADITKSVFIDSLKQFGNAKEASHSLGIPLSTFYRRMKKFGISL